MSAITTPADLPPLLYKFLRPASAGLIASGQVRFSQFAALNDPFEFVTSTSEEELFRQIGEMFTEVRQELDVKAHLDVELEKLFNEDPRFRSLPPSMREALKPMARSFAESRLPLLQSELNNTLDSITPVLSAEVARKFIRGIRQGEVIIFSATEIWDAPPMWAHYADQSKGFVLGFEPATAFRNENPKSNERLPYLIPRKVTYSKSVPEIIVKSEGPIEFLTNKLTDWAYEREWRYTRPPIEGVTGPVDDSGEIIHLFPVEASAVNEVIFGIHCTPDTISKVQSSMAAIGATPSYYQAELGIGALLRRPAS